MSIPLRVLLLEDLPSDAQLVLFELRQAGFQPIWTRVETEQDFLAHLEPAPEIILADFNLPQFDAPSALRLTRELGLDVPFLVVSGSIGEDVAVEVMLQGADDYLLKDRLSRLGTAVKRALEQKRLRDEKRVAEDALRKTQKRLEHVVTSNPAVLYTLNVENESLRLGWVSNNLPNMMGYSVEDAFKARWWEDGLHPDDAPQVIGQINQALHAHGEVTNEYRFRHREGDYRWVRNEMRLLYDSLGHPHEVVGSWSDITQQKRLEEQFHQSQKMEAIGKLAGGIAHDFNNLLTVIGGYSEIILDSLHPEDPLHEPIEQIKKAGERAAALTRQLLAFSRKQVLTPIVLDLNSLLADMEKMLRRLIGEDVDLVIRPAPDLWKVTADAGQMEQVVMNLSVNARDAMPEGGQLTIETSNIELDEAYERAHPDASAGRYVLLRVTDDGTGIEKAVLPQIFEPFFTTKALNKGTGLGLSTVYGIIKQSGGHVEVSSEVGVGTTFKVFIPSGRHSAVSSTTRLGIKARLRGHETILLVEDEEGVRALAQSVLERNGYRVLTAKHGEEALELSERNSERIHLLVTDVVMPQMSGRQLAERLLETRTDLKVLYMSGYTDNAIFRHGILSQDTPFIQKPFVTEVFVQKVRDVLEKTGF